MSTKVTGSVQLNISGQLTNASGGTLYSQAFLLSLQNVINQSFTSGNGGAGLVDQCYVSQRVLAHAANERLNMYSFGGALDTVGNAFTFATVKALFIQNLGLAGGPLLEADYLSVGNDATSGAWVSPFGTNTDILKIPGGGAALLMAPGTTGYAVVNTTNNLLKVLNSGAANAITYNVVVFGATA